MKQYNKIYVPNDLDQLATTWMLFNLKKSEYPLGGLDEKQNVIVLTKEELLDLMQEAIEHAHSTLTRDRADKLLESKLQQNES